VTDEADRVDQPEHVTTHVITGLARLGQQFINAADLRALQASYLKEVQALEDALWAMLTDTLETAIGAQLEVIGRIVGQQRGSLTDEPYRVFLRAAIAANKSRGTGEDLILVTSLMLGGLSTFILTEYPRAFVLIEPLISTLYPDIMIRVLRRTKAGGVRLQLIVVPEGDIFAFAASGIVNQVDADHGWSDNAGLVGGKLVGIVE
jgi:hypothetical protein